MIFMHTDARLLSDFSEIEGDICIVGAGAAGISIALQWINTPYKVILLEGGGFEYDDKVQDLYKGKTTGQGYYPLRSARLHYFGGTTGHWGGCCSIFEPSAFKKRDWINESGWPFDEKELEPYYKKASDILDIGEFSFDLAYWQQKDSSLTALPLDDKVLYSKIWRHRVPKTLRFGSHYKDVIEQATNIHLYTYANVTEIESNESASAVTSIIAKNHTGKSCRVSARYYVLASCAIQNSRLLLASNKHSPRGLGNDHDLVGRYFMENLEIKEAELWLKKRSKLKLYERGVSPNVQAELAITPEAQVGLQIANGMLSFTPLEIARKTPPYIKTWTSEDPREASQRVSEIDEKATEGKSRISKLFGPTGYESFMVTLRLEQTPNPLSRITLDTEKDELGVPRAMLNWALTSMEKKSLQSIYRLLGQQVGIAGIGRVKLSEELYDEHSDTMPDSTSGGWHHMGTTRMHNDPHKGVVDANCKVHGIANLYIAGSSCFTNGAAVNPTFTIVTLSVRLAEHLKQMVGHGNVVTTSSPGTVKDSHTSP